jgi:hypothetical protein
LKRGWMQFLRNDSAFNSRAIGIVGVLPRMRLNG